MLYHQISGNGSAVLLIHGYLENLKMWDDISFELSKNHLVIRCDNPGHGRSPNYSEIHGMELVAQKINEVIESLGVSEVSVVGHSMGGYIALAFAELFPEKVKSVFLMNSSSLADTDEKKGLRKRAAEVAQKNMEALIKMSIPLLFAENSKGLENQKEFARQLMRETSIPGVLAALKGMSQRPDRTEILQNFEGKIGVILGTKDRTVDPIAFKNVIPQKHNISILEVDCGHMSYLEKPDETLKFLKDFIG